MNFQRISEKKAISTILTTLIILVASVVLATGVVLYGSSLFKTGSQASSLDVTGVQVWSDKSGSGWAWGAAKVRNNGDKLISVDSINIRGTIIPFSNWYVDTSPTSVTTENLQQELNYSSKGILYGITSVSGGMSNGTNDGISVVGCTYDQTHLIIQLSRTTPNLCLTQTTGPVSLSPGDKAIIYFKAPQNLLTTIDAGTSNSVQIYAQQVGTPQIVTTQSK